MPFDSAPQARITLAELAKTLQAELRPGTADDSATPITGVAAIEDAVSGQITFVANPKYATLCPNDAGHSRSG